MSRNRPLTGPSERTVADERIGSLSFWGSALVSSSQAATPTGAVTFLFTDVEGSTHRWEADAEAMRAALAAHDAVLRSATEASGPQRN